MTVKTNCGFLRHAMAFGHQRDQFLPPDTKDALRFELPKSEPDSGGKVKMLWLNWKILEEIFHVCDHP